MYKTFVAVFIFLFLIVQPAFPESNPLNDLNTIEKSLNITSKTKAIVPRIETIENILYGHTIQDNITNRITNIQSTLGQNSLEEKPVFDFKYNPYVGDYYNESCKMRVPKWKKLPVTVYINNVPTKYKEKVIEAINNWQSFFPLEISDNPDSDINIIWVDKLSKSSREHTVGQAENTFYNNVHRCTIKILNNNNYLPFELEEITIHELGHAIGLGHSPNSQDMMYPKILVQKGKISGWNLYMIGSISLILPTNIQRQIPGRTIITQRDINTLAKIYTEYDDPNVHLVNNKTENPNTSQVNAEHNIYHEQDIKQYIDVANTYFNNGGYEQAAEYIKRALAINPNNPIANQNLGACYIYLNRYDEAIVYLQRALAVNANDPNTYNNLGTVYKNKGQYQLAIENYEKALSINPNLDVAYNNLGTVYLETGKTEQAISKFNKSIELNSNNANAYNNVGIAYKQKGNYTQAEECFKKALLLSPNNSTIRNNLKGLPGRNKSY